MRFCGYCGASLLETLSDAHTLRPDYDGNNSSSPSLSDLPTLPDNLENGNPSKESISDSETIIGQANGSTETKKSSQDGSLSDQETVLFGDSAGLDETKQPEGPASLIDQSTNLDLHGVTETVLKRFEILDSIGEGGMGVVLRARDRKLGREVALKRLRPETQTNRKAIDRFWGEAKAIASLNHFNVVHVYDVIEDELGLCIAMELVAGEDLAERIEREGPLPADQVRDLSLIHI